MGLTLLAPAAGRAETLTQQPLQSIQGSVRQSGRNDASLRRPFRGGEQGVLLQITCLQPFPKYFSVHENVIQQPAVTDAIEAGLDIALEDPIGTTGISTVWPTKDLVALVQGVRTTPLQSKPVGWPVPGQQTSG